METPLPENPGSDASRPALNISIQELSRKVKHPDILKYLPDGLLTGEQKEVKWQAIADTIAYTNEKNDRMYQKYLKNGQIKAAEAMVKAAAKAAGYVTAAYHGTGEYFNSFRRGYEGIHLAEDRGTVLLSSKAEGYCIFSNKRQDCSAFPYAAVLR